MFLVVIREELLSTKCLAYVNAREPFGTNTLVRSSENNGLIEERCISILKNDLKLEDRWKGNYLRYLRFADDILMCANTPHELQQMLQELADESKKL